MDIFLLEAAINGLLLAGVLALLTLGLNLIFGVIDVVWIAYADLVMCGMYAVYWLFAVFGWPLPLAFAVSVVGVAVLGVFVHLLIIAPILGSAPINQLLATGGLLYFLQSFATLLFTTDFRNIGVRLPVLEIGRNHAILLQLRDRLAIGRVLVGVDHPRDPVRRALQRGAEKTLGRVRVSRLRKVRSRASPRSCRSRGKGSASGPSPFT